MDFGPRTDKWEEAEQDWNKAIERAGGNEVKATGLLLAQILHELEDQSSRMKAQLERDWPR